MEALQKHRKALLILLPLAAAYTALWSYDPVVTTVRQRFPSAVVRDYTDYRWLIPPFLRPRFAAATDPLLDGSYLRVELSDQTVDLQQFIDVPFFILILTRCHVSDLTPVDAMHLGNRSILLRDCDLTGVPASRLNAVAYTRRCSFQIGGP